MFVLKRIGKCLECTIPFVGKVLDLFLLTDNPSYRPRKQTDPICDDLRCIRPFFSVNLYIWSTDFLFTLNHTLTRRWLLVSFPLKFGSKSTKEVIRVVLECLFYSVLRLFRKGVPLLTPSFTVGDNFEVGLTTQRQRHLIHLNFLSKVLKGK